MTPETLATAVAEAKRFLRVAGAVEIRTVPGHGEHKAWKTIDAGKVSGAVKRASLDLTRALADMRRP